MDLEWRLATVVAAVFAKPVDAHTELHQRLGGRRGNRAPATTCPRSS